MIINNNAIDRIKYQIIYCKTSNSPIIMYYRDSFIYNETQIEYFDNETTMIERDIAKYPFKLTFDSNEDFIFSYSFIDNTDKIFNNNQEFINERKELDKLNIVDIIKPNPLRNIFNIKFYPNYKYSSTRYIIIIALKDENNNINTFSDRCYLTQLITEKNDNITIKEFVDIGDNEYVIADIEYEFKSNVSYVINIISQELRFSKKLNYYMPYEFKYNKENIIDINIGKEQIFELGNNNDYFNLNYNKVSNKKEMLLLYYTIKLINPINIKIITNTYEENFVINNNEGYINFLGDKSGSYIIKFEENKINNLLKGEITSNGTFMIFSTENAFNIDISKDKIEFNEFNITNSEPTSLKLKIESFDKDYTKKILLSNKKELNDLILISKNDQNYEKIKFNYYTFEKNNKYNIIINFNQRDSKINTLEKLSIQSYSLDNIQYISFVDKIYNDTEDKFIIIDWCKYNFNNISIQIKKNNPKLLIANINENQSKNINKEFQNIQFTLLTDLDITKPINYNYSVILIELNENETQIFFTGIVKEEEGGGKGDEGQNGNNGKEEEGFPVTYTILISVIGGVVVLGVIAFFVIKYLRKKNQIDFNAQPKGLSKADELITED